MNRWVATGISAVTLVAAVALFFTGHMLPAAIALAFSVVCDIVFVLASRQSERATKDPNGRPYAIRLRRRFARKRRRAACAASSIRSPASTT